MVTKAEPRILVRATSLNSYLNRRDAGSLQHSLLNLTTTTTASCIAFNVLYPHIARTKYTIPQMQLSSEIMRHLPTCHTCTYIAFSGEYFLGRPSAVGTIGDVALAVAAVVFVPVFSSACEGLVGKTVERLCVWVICLIALV